MFTPPIELSLGEAFVYGDFDIEGDIFSGFSLIDDIATRSFSPGDIATLTRDLLALPGAASHRLEGRGLCAVPLLFRRCFASFLCQRCPRPLACRLRVLALHGSPPSYLGLVSQPPRLSAGLVLG